MAPRRRLPGAILVHVTTTEPGLEGRYGTPSPWRRRALVGAVVVVVLAFAGWLAWSTWVHANPEVTSELVSFEIVDDHTATGVLEVDVSGGLADDERAGTEEATCTVRALAEDKSTVGQTSITPDPDGGTVEVTIRTERLATSVESLGCTTPGQNRPR